uniref:Uncharacterized protein n=1 Tax=Anguilla anguilla TaxID=7936 RepID=A0A0E9TJ52_ANGAN
MSMLSVSQYLKSTFHRQYYYIFPCIYK